MIKKGFGLLAANFLIAFFSLLPNTHRDQINLSFDSLFPTVWYQKGLESSVRVWRVLSDAFDQNNENTLLMSWDCVVGQLAFTQFCINRMYQEEDFLLDEDVLYFSAVVHKIQKLILLFTLNAETYDCIACTNEMLQVMQESLQKVKVTFRFTCSSQC